MNNQRHTGGALVIVPHTEDDHTKVAAPDWLLTKVLTTVPERIAGELGRLIVCSSFPFLPLAQKALFTHYVFSFLFTVVFT